MNLKKQKPEVQRTLAIAIPLAALLLGVLLVVPKVVGLRTTHRLVTASRQVVLAKQQETALERERQGQQQNATRPHSRDEQLTFLKELNQTMGTCGVHLVSYRPPGGPGSKAEAEPTSGTGGGVLPIATDVTVSGSYSNLFLLFHSLARAERVFTVEKLQARTDSYPRLSATFRLVRYVTLAAEPQARPALPPMPMTMASRETQAVVKLPGERK